MAHVHKIVLSRADVISTRILVNMYTKIIVEFLIVKYCT